MANINLSILENTSVGANNPVPFVVTDNSPTSNLTVSSGTMTLPANFAYELVGGGGPISEHSFSASTFTSNWYVDGVLDNAQVSVENNLISDLTLASSPNSRDVELRIDTDCVLVGGVMNLLIIQS